MLSSHINAIEQALLAQSNIANSAGHPNLRGGPREWFIREFLKGFLPLDFEIAQGEIINSDSIPNPPQGQYRPQVDIVVYKKSYPKITYSLYDSSFFIEGVLASIESKSTITEVELKKACKTSCIHKAMKKDSTSKLFTYVIAYNGPESIDTVAGWLPDISKDLNAPVEDMVDMIIVLGKGIVWQTSKFELLKNQMKGNASNWTYLNQEHDNLFLLFMHMLTWLPVDMIKYVPEVFFEEYKTI